MTQPFELHRVAIRKDGAFGVLLHDGLPFAVTLERTYDGLDENDSSAPKISNGIYRCTPTSFHRGGYPTLEVHVPGFSRLLFHRGNVETDSDGCVLVAESFGALRGEAAILDSAGGFGEFMRRAANYPGGFPLAVTGAEA